MSDIRTKPATEEYRKGWERVFGKKAKVLKLFCPKCFASHTAVFSVRELSVGEFEFHCKMCGHRWVEYDE